MGQRWSFAAGGDPLGSRYRKKPTGGKDYNETTGRNHPCVGRSLQLGEGVVRARLAGVA